MNPTTNIAIQAARLAGDVIMRSYRRIETLTISEKQSNDYVSEVDRASEQLIIDAIRKYYPNHGILAEESGEQDGNDFLWIIDPLDGTTNFIHGFPQFAVSIALKHKESLISAVVYDPLNNEMFTASKGNGALMNDKKIRVTDRKGLNGALLGTGIPYTDQTHIETYVKILKLLAKDTAGIRRPGSASLDFSYLAAGRIDGFWEFGLSPWDFAAGALIVQEAGGVVTDLNGGNRFFESGNVIAGGIKLHKKLLDVIAPFLTNKLNF